MAIRYFNNILMNGSSEIQLNNNLNKIYLDGVTAAINIDTDKGVRVDAQGVISLFGPNGMQTGDSVLGNDIILNVNDPDPFIRASNGTNAGLFNITNTLTSNRTWQLPDQSGTFAMVEDLAGGVTFKGGYDAATNTPDLDVSPTGVLTGDMYTVTVAGSFFTIPVEVGDVLISKVDGPIVTADWTYIEKGGDYISGSGTTNYVARFTPDGVTLGDSIIQDNGATVAIGTLNPAASLNIEDTLTNGIRVINTKTNGTARGALFAAQGASNTGNNVGILVSAESSTTENIAGLFAATAGAGGGTPYAVQLSDGTETPTGGKFLKDTGSGKANWATITAADVSGLSTVTELNDLSDVTTGLPVTPTAADDGRILFYDIDSGEWISDDTVNHGTVIINAYSGEGVTIDKGTPVYLTGNFANDAHEVGIADADDPTKMPVIGFAAEDVLTASTNSKHVCTFGKLQGVDTTSTGAIANGESWTAGDILYMSTTPGVLTLTRPTGASTGIQRIAQVLRVDATGGQIFIFNTARTAGLPNLTTNNLWVGNGNDLPVEVLNTEVGIYAGSGTVPTTTVASITDTLDFGSGNLLRIDETNGLIGINTTSTSGTLNIIDNKLYGVYVENTQSAGTAHGARFDLNTVNTAENKGIQISTSNGRNNIGIDIGGGLGFGPNTDIGYLANLTSSTSSAANVYGGYLRLSTVATAWSNKYGLFIDSKGTQTVSKTAAYGVRVNMQDDMSLGGSSYGNYILQSSSAASVNYGIYAQLNGTAPSSYGVRIFNTNTGSSNYGSFIQVSGGSSTNIGQQVSLTGATGTNFGFISDVTGASLQNRGAKFSADNATSYNVGIEAIAGATSATVTAGDVGMTAQVKSNSFSTSICAWIKNESQSSTSRGIFVDDTSAAPAIASGTRYGIDMTLSQAATTNTGLRIDVQNAATSNIAIQTLDGDNELNTVSGHTDFQGGILKTGALTEAAGSTLIAPGDQSIVKLQNNGTAVTATLANGVAGQRLTIYVLSAGSPGTGSTAVTPTTAAGYTSITLAQVGDSVDLIYDTTIGWVIIGSNSVTIA